MTCTATECDDLIGLTHDAHPKDRVTCGIRLPRLSARLLNKNMQHKQFGVCQGGDLCVLCMKQFANDDMKA